MQLCPRCNAAVEAGRSHCPICDQPVAASPADPTRVQGAPVPAPPPAYEAPPAYGPPAAYGPPPGYGPPPPGYGYGAPPGALPPPRSKVAAALLCFFLGYLGIHRFYTGQTGIGLALLLSTLIAAPLTCGLSLAVTFVWVLVDLVLILTGGVSDQWGRPLT